MKMDTMGMTIEDKIAQYFLLRREGGVYRPVIEDTEKILIEKALEIHDGNQLSAARILGLNRNTLRAKIKRLNIDLERFRK